MKCRSVILSALLFLAGPAPAERCWTVEGDRILAADLARAREEFAGLAPEEMIAYAPAPGAKRVFSAAQLARLAKRYGLPEAPVAGVCFERASDTLTAERVLTALRAALEMPEAKLELVDFSRCPLPRGELQFRRGGLAAPPGGQPNAPVLWRGSVLYGDQRSAPVWARVRISVKRRQVTALRDLTPGRLIRAEELAEEEVEAFPGAEPPLELIQQAAGSLPRRTIRAGQPLYAASVKLPNDVERGDTVVVEVTSGGARLVFEARAQSGGKRGEQVFVQNPFTGRAFPAQVEGKGKVAVRTDGEGRVL